VSGLRNVALAAIAGWVMHLAFPAFGFWPAAALGLALLWIALERATIGKGFGLGLVAGLGFFLPLIRWTEVAVGPLPWIALCLLESLAVGLFGAVWALARRHGPMRRTTPLRRTTPIKRAFALEPVVFATLWTSAEVLRSLVPWGGFPWGRLAFSQVDAPPVGLAWLGGASLVTFAVAVAGGCLGLASEAVQARRLFLPAIALGGAVVVTLVGALIPLDSSQEAGTLRVGVAQGSVPNLGLDSFDQARKVLENHVSATEEMAEHLEWTPDLVIWPENAADYDPRVDGITRDAVTEVSRLIGAPILLGTQDYSPPKGRYNVALLWTENGEVIGTYAKRHPAPFAEYIPWRSFARIFSSAVDRVSRDMIPGTEIGLFEVPVPRLDRDVAVGDVICFEVAYDGIVRDAIRAGGEILIVQTNNANFGMTPESVQQLAMTRFRAIETGRAAIQSSTVGVSAIVAPDGEIIDRTGLFTADYMLEEVPLRTSLTPAVRFGAIIDWAFLLAPLVAAMALGLAKLRGRWEWD